MKNGRIVYGWGNEYWYKDGRIHRDDGPAIIYHGTESWYKNGELHREEGPAFISKDGHKEWWLHNKQFSKEEAWWEALSPEMKVKALFNGEGV